jgi:photosystem II stability/assembly factor-like uncharacterized protein
MTRRSLTSDGRTSCRSRCVSPRPSGERVHVVLEMSLCSLLAFALGSGCVIPLSTLPGDGGVAEGGLSDDGGPFMPPPGSWTIATGNLATMASECGNLSALFTKPGQDLLIAGVAARGLWASSDGGGSWQQLGTGMGSESIMNAPQSLVFDPADSTRYWESGIHNGAGVFETSDDGQTFVSLGANSLGANNNDLVAVDYSDPNRQTLILGSHEASLPAIYRSRDGGKTWGAISSDLPTNTDCTHPLLIDSQTYLVGCGGYGGGTSGVYRTTNGGGRWTNVTASGGANSPLRASDKSIYWASPNGQGITRSLDDGQTWADVVQPSIFANIATNGTGHTVSPIELPDSRLATFGSVNGSLYVVVSSDHGAHWRAATSALPYTDAWGVVYSPQQLAFYTWHFTCLAGANPILADAVMRFDFDYRTN